jgi:hypothetical protein
MRVSPVVLAALLVALLAPTAVADEGHGRGRGHDDDRSSQSVARVSINLASGRAAAGASDPNVLVTLPGASSAAAAVVCSSQPGIWAAALRGTAWISPTASCPNDQAAGQYRYDIPFSVPSGSTGLRLTGSALSDDTLNVQLNGHTVNLSSGSGLSFVTRSTFETSDQSAFQSGTNTLSFFVNNSVGQTGLDFRARVTTSNARAEKDEKDDDEDEDNHGQCVSEVAHSTARGPGHGEAVRDAAHDCD